MSSFPELMDRLHGRTRDTSVDRSDPVQPVVGCLGLLLFLIVGLILFLQYNAWSRKQHSTVNQSSESLRDPQQYGPEAPEGSTTRYDTEAKIPDGPAYATDREAARLNTKDSLTIMRSQVAELKRRNELSVQDSATEICTRYYDLADLSLRLYAVEQNGADLQTAINSVEVIKYYSESSNPDDSGAGRRFYRLVQSWNPHSKSLVNVTD